MTAPLRVGNCSGFYGDRFSAMREMLEGGALDVLTGDYLAELTMLILGRDRMKDPQLGYARTFVRQVEGALGTALDQGVKLVANAGGLNPAGLAERLGEVAQALGLSPRIAYVDGDDVVARVAELGLDASGTPVTANAYLGAFGIAAALEEGADIVVTGRVTDASVVVGPAIAHFGWSRTDYDALAGAVVAGHVIECGTQASGGNFSGFRELAVRGLLAAPLGFPLAEISADGSSVITKHEGTGGAITIDTVTAQVMYEIQSTRYLGPDVTTLLDTISLEQGGEDRVAISGVRGEEPPETLKVCLNNFGGFKNSAEFILTGLDLEEKAAWVQAQTEAGFQVRPADVEWTFARTDHADADTEEGASARLRVTVRDPKAEVAGKGFTAPIIELALGSYPGFSLTGPPAPATPYGVYRPAYIPRDAVCETVHHLDGKTRTLRFPPASGTATSPPAAPTSPPTSSAGAPTGRVSVPLGHLIQARSGDKGGDANLGLWVSALDPKGDERAAWLAAVVDEAWIKALLPEAQDLVVAIHHLPRLRAVNVVIEGLLGKGVAATSRFDPQAKGLGEWARSRYVEIEERLA